MTASVGVVLGLPEVIPMLLQIQRYEAEGSGPINVACSGLSVQAAALFTA